MQIQAQPLKIYNASAGSGKTYTLVKEYLKIVLSTKDSMKFRSVLAMTFTNKAANEMKERVIETLMDLACESLFKTAEQLETLADKAKELNMAPKLIESRANAVLNKILHNYSSFSVMTLDKFTHKVVRTFAKDLGISVDFNIEMDIESFRKNITDLLMDQIGRNQKLTHLMKRYANENLDEEKTWNISKDIYNFTNLLFKEDAIDAIALLEDLRDEDFITIADNLKKENAKIINKLDNSLNEVIELIESKGLSTDDFASKSTSVLAYFKRQPLKAKGYQLPSATLQKHYAEDAWSHKSSPKRAIVDSIADLISQYFNQIHLIIQNEIPQYKLKKNILQNINNLALLKYLLELIDKVKEEENILLISDFYKEIAEIITKERVPFIYERLGVRYQHFLLDEFQDTSELQWINLIPLVHNSLAQQHKNLIVGDGKQAIYRWRNGEVEQFTKLPEQIHNPGNIPSLHDAEAIFKEMGEKITLEHNYRSAPEIVNFNNYYFGELGLKLDESLEYIYHNHNQTPTKKFNGYVEALLKKGLEEEEQVAFILQSVKKSIEAGFQLKDICIIVRVNSAGAKVASALTDANYAVISPDSLFVSKDKTVQFLYYLMQGLSNENDKNAKIKAIEHYAVLNGKQPADLIISQQEDIAAKTLQAYFTEKNIDLKEPASFHNLYDYVEYLLEAFDFDATDNPYLQFYLESVHQFETSKSTNIRDFLQWFNEKGRKKSIISPEGANAIKIMTIHKSKGLQFPVVICPFFNWKLDLSREIAWVKQANQPLPAYFLKMRKDLADSPLAPIYLKEQAKFNLDNFNLLYVAFTRPEVALFISGKTDSGSVKEYIEPIFSAHPNMQNPEEGIYKQGILELPFKTIEGNAEDTSIKIQFLKQKMNKPELSYKSALEWDIEELDQKRHFGTLVHDVLSKIESQTELAEALNNIQLKNGWTITEKDAVFDYINVLFKNEQFANYFVAECFNEKEIVSAKGLKLIPDKLIKTETGFKVIDFKTGQPSPSHQKQVESYIKVLEDMGYDDVTGELCYTEGLEFVAV
ncbi:MAG: UvrD-helicase domain-containing protein [Crocinitomicaceae bacterium]